MEATMLTEYRELHEAIYRCRLCKRHGHYVERVQPKWDPAKATAFKVHRWGMLIGQAPGKSERAKERALQGRAGRGLFRWLLQAGFSEKQAVEQVYPELYKTSITKCYPGKDGRNDRKPTAEEVKLCAPFLRQQLQSVRPRVLILMGLAAIRWFFPEVRKLEEVVGRQRSWHEDALDCKVICLPHPSPGSRWLNAEGNRELLRSALRMLFEVWTADLQPTASSDGRD